MLQKDESCMGHKRVHKSFALLFFTSFSDVCVFITAAAAIRVTHSSLSRISLMLILLLAFFPQSGAVSDFSTCLNHPSCYDWNYHPCCYYYSYWLCCLLHNI